MLQDSDVFDRAGSRRTLAYLAGSEHDHSVRLCLPALLYWRVGASTRHFHKAEGALYCAAGLFSLASPGLAYLLPQRICAMNYDFELV